MPIYEYICKECSHEWEALRPMSQSDAPIACESCGKSHARRKLSVFYAESGGKAVAGMSEPSCGSCTAGSCAGCGH